jgi:hypothetical protein
MRGKFPVIMTVMIPRSVDSERLFFDGERHGNKFFISEMEKKKGHMRSTFLCL